ncbi:TIGR04141 family sporadically distributed protein [uncultured Roseobacter sp.]|uniref:DUF6119 family protein n=1 Tax=uncultured Roseobacter sp. TaxID=114847 RepID=UPI00262821E2|nr:TIGR04141 family sporadically distributed protein [uncultured Roseobacter sp.]
MPRFSYTIFLAKAPRADFEAYLTENARNNIGTAGHQAINVDELGENSILHVFRGSSGPPPWMRRLAQRIPELQLVNRQSVAALLFVHVGHYLIVVSYSHGWMLLNENMFESDFGLLVAINSLDPEKLKRLERSNLGDALQGVAQSPFQRDFNSFGVDDALDLVKKLSGAAQDDSGLDTVTGARSLKITGEYSLDDVVAMSGDIVELFKSSAYRNTAFSIIDSVRPVTDGPLRNELFAMVVDSIKANEDRFELGLPANTEAEGVSFRFSGPGLRRAYPDLLLRHYVEAMGARIGEITTQTLGDHKIISEFDDDRPNMIWPIRKALLGSISKDGERYAINDGRWYRIDNTFKTSIEGSFSDVVRDWDIPRPGPIRKIYDEAGNGRIEIEADYNARIAQDLGLVLLDRTEIRIPNVVRSGFEPCDLLDVANKRFIHVKKNSRRSNILSHFFKQGSNSAQQFRKVAATWAQLVELVRDAGHEQEATRLEEQENNQGEGWSVEFWVVDAPRSTGEFNIPFFSKISLRDEVSDLRAMQYEVALRFIEIAPDNI